MVIFKNNDYYYYFNDSYGIEKRTIFNTKEFATVLSVVRGEITPRK